MRYEQTAQCQSARHQSAQCQSARHQTAPRGAPMVPPGQLLGAAHAAERTVALQRAPQQPGAHVAITAEELLLIPGGENTV
jgi:hypothetical protein